MGSTNRCLSRRPVCTATVDSACSEDAGPCLKMAGVQPPAPVARTFSDASEKALGNLSAYEAKLLVYSQQMDEIEGQLGCGTH